MKENSAEKLPYFSAYPLKALNLPEEEYQSQLHLRTSGTYKPSNRIRVSPMANPYKEKDFEKAKNDPSENIK